MAYDEDTHITHISGLSDGSIPIHASARGPLQASTQCRQARLGAAHFTEPDVMEPHAALAELVDNASDEGATLVTIDVAGDALVFADDGPGCSADAIVGALGGHRTTTKTDASLLKTGKYGQAFARACLSLGREVTILSYPEAHGGDVLHVACVSPRLLEDTGAAACLLPVATFKRSGGAWAEHVETEDGRVLGAAYAEFGALAGDNLRNVLLYGGLGGDAAALLDAAAAYQRPKGLVLLIGDLDARVDCRPGEETIFFKQSEGQTTKTVKDKYRYKQDARYALGWNYPVFSGVADELPSHLERLAREPASSDGRVSSRESRRDTRRHPTPSPSVGGSPAAATSGSSAGSCSPWTSRRAPNPTARSSATATGSRRTCASKARAARRS